MVRLLLAIAVVACGCNAIISLEPGHRKADASAGGHGGAGEGGASSSSASVGGGGASTGGGCPGGTAECDGDGATACETNLATSSVHCGACGHDCLGSACQAGACVPTLLATDATKPLDLAVDATHVYWTDRGSYQIARAPKAGGKTEVLATGEQEPVGIAVDDATVYWTTYESSGALRAKPKADLAAAPVSLSTAESYPWMLALGTTDVFFATLSAVRRVPKDGLSPAVDVVQPANPVDLTVFDDVVYWTEHDYPKGSVWAADAAGSATKLVTGEPCMADACPRGIAASDAGVFYALFLVDGAIKRAVDGQPGSPQVLAGAQEEPYEVAVDATHVYWTNSHYTANQTMGANGSIWKMPLVGGTPVKLADDQDEPRGLAVDATHVYWANYLGGTIARVAK